MHIIITNFCDQLLMEIVTWTFVYKRYRIEDVFVKQTTFNTNYINITN